MDAFIIHSSTDSAVVQQALHSIKQKIYTFNPLLLGSKKKVWKTHAARKIKLAQIVVFFVGKNSHNSPYIEWELKESIRMNKPLYVIKLHDDYIDHHALMVQDTFSDQQRSYGQNTTLTSLIEMLARYEDGDFTLFNQTVDAADIHVLLEQYKAFLQTSEALVARRQSVSSFFISINAALFSLFGIFASIKPDITLFSAVVVCGCIFGSVLSYTWIRLLTSYGSLNASKIRIITEIEKHLPLSLFASEWQVMSNKLNKSKYVSFTDNESRVPKTMIGFYMLMLLGLFVYQVIVHL